MIQTDKSQEICKFKVDTLSLIQALVKKNTQWLKERIVFRTSWLFLTCIGIYLNGLCIGMCMCACVCA